LIVFDDVLLGQVRMKAKVVIVRVLRDGATSVVLHVQNSNAVLKCEVTGNSTQILREGQTATVRVVAYKPPFIHVHIEDDGPGHIADNGPGHIADSGSCVYKSTEVNVNAGPVQWDGREASERAPLRRRICWAK
jgi:hypothetical protein